MRQPLFWLYPLVVLVASGGIVGFEIWVKSFQKENVTKLFKGFIIGLVLGAAFSAIVRSFGVEVTPFLRVIIYLGMIYLGVALFSQLEIGMGFSQAPARKGAAPESLKILDTSVIIDGRIADIIETKFIEGILVVPKFVLDELQQIADSSDSVKRSRGRRGLDVLNRLRKKKDILLRITDRDFPEIPDVDSKLVKLAKTLDAKVITNDFNLLKVAEIQDVEVLNINLLTNALKPVVLPGEKMKLVVIKEGKDPGQGIGYLDDGTMVVVDSGKRWVGEKIEVTVTSVLQTPAGRMIFAKYEGE
ncbi:MAG: TRAM domain-containing protein [Spirochaetes bacterium]|nr:TRAM domain-containing protein [Spirochaetota bacterium]